MSSLTLEGAPPRAMPPAFHLMVKPRGAVCNLDCTYCFYSRKEDLYEEGASFRMSDEVLESFTRQYIEAQRVPEVTFGWQGGEPTLMGLDFFRKAVAMQEKYRKPGMKIANALQTNGVLLDDEWCRFLKEHQFLIGLSMDGPRELHDAYRVDKGGKPTFDKVYRALKLLQRHGVDFNILCVLNRVNADHPLTVYRFFKSEGVQFIQFIPAVERIVRSQARSEAECRSERHSADASWLTTNELVGSQARSEAECRPERDSDERHSADASWLATNEVTEWTVRAEQWGQFLCSVFDEWVRRDVGRVFVQSFDVALQAWVGMEPSLCVHAKTCGDCLAIEHNGDLFSCDHYVDPHYFLGNVMEMPMTELVASPFQRKFGRDKRDTLPRYCRECPVLFACNGGCPKDRFITTPDGEPGLHYLCAGYKRFFTHVAPYIRTMAELLHRGHPPAAIMDILRRKEIGAKHLSVTGGLSPTNASPLPRVSRNAPCPCGSGRKYKSCCGT